MASGRPCRASSIAAATPAGTGPGTSRAEAVHEVAQRLRRQQLGPVEGPHLDEQAGERGAGDGGPGPRGGDAERPRDDRHRLALDGDLRARGVVAGREEPGGDSRSGPTRVPSLSATPRLAPEPAAANGPSADSASSRATVAPATRAGSRPASSRRAESPPPASSRSTARADRPPLDEGASTRSEISSPPAETSAAFTVCSTLPRRPRRVHHGEAQVVGGRVHHGLAGELHPLAVPARDALVGPARRHLAPRARQGEPDAHGSARPAHPRRDEEAHLAAGAVPQRVGGGADRQAALHERRAERRAQERLGRRRRGAGC